MDGSAPDGSINDTSFYEFTAASLADGSGYTGLTGEPTAGWPPVFPFLVSLLYRVFGIRLNLALGLNVVLATATVILIYLVAERMLGRREARVALFAILPGPLYMTGLFLSETTFIFALVGFLALVVYLPRPGLDANSARRGARSGGPDPRRGLPDAGDPAGRVVGARRQANVAAPLRRGGRGDGAGRRRGRSETRW